MVKVAQCKRVHLHQGQQSGQGMLTIGLAVFGMYLEVIPPEPDNTPILFRVLLNLFQGGFLVVLVMNMIQAVVPMTLTNGKPVSSLLRPWAKKMLQDTVIDTVWYLTLLVALVWAVAIAAVVSTRKFDDGARSLGWEIFYVVAVVLGTSFVTINPGMAILWAWGIVWLIPTGLAFVFRSMFDAGNRLIQRLSLAMRRMVREWSAHLRASVARVRVGRWCSMRDTLVMVLQVLPLTPLLVLFIPLPLLCALTWCVHVILRLLLKISDLVIAPISTFKMYPVLSDYGSVTWKMGTLDMSVERSPMRTLLKRRVSKLLEVGKLGELVRGGVIPAGPYCHLRQGSPKLGCVAIAMDDTDTKILKVGRDIRSGSNDSSGKSNNGDTGS